MNITELTNKIGTCYNVANTEMGQYSIKILEKSNRIDRLFKNNGIYVIVETKNNINHELINDKPQLDKYVNAIFEQEQPKHIIGILARLDTNEVITFVDGERRDDLNKILPMEKYEELFVNAIDRDAIYKLTKRINDNLHVNFGMKDLQNRMVFTACALVAKSRFDCDIESRKGKGYVKLREEIRADLGCGLADDTRHNDKLCLLLEAFSKIEVNNEDNIVAVDSFIDDVCEISSYINNKDWRGEDIMAIFFNEFNRYRAKSDLGQVFTPEHIASFMCKLLGVKKGDRVLDAACGSGTFLTKAMSTMLKECETEEERKNVFANGVYGVEYDKDIYTLAVSNMLIHKDGKTNLICGDSRSKKIGEWIKKNNITKVLMNPPYEDKYGCMEIVKNVLDNVPAGTMCAFIMPNQQLVKSNNWKKLKDHRLTTIIKLPEETFDASTDTSIYVYEAGVKQGTNKVCGYRIVEDGLVRVKNRGRHDIMHRWEDIETEMLNAIKYGDHETKQVFAIEEQQNYKMPIAQSEIYWEDINKVIATMNLYTEKIDFNQVEENVIENTMWTIKE